MKTRTNRPHSWEPETKPVEPTKDKPAEKSPVKEQEEGNDGS